MERKYTDRKDILLIVSLLITAGLLYVPESRQERAVKSFWMGKQSPLYR